MTVASVERLLRIADNLQRTTTALCYLPLPGQTSRLLQELLADPSARVTALLAEMLPAAPRVATAVDAADSEIVPDEINPVVPFAVPPAMPAVVPARSGVGGGSAGMRVASGRSGPAPAGEPVSATGSPSGSRARPAAGPVTPGDGFARDRLRADRRATSAAGSARGELQRNAASESPEVRRGASEKPPYPADAPPQREIAHPPHTAVALAGLRPALAPLQEVLADLRLLPDAAFVETLPPATRQQLQRIKRGPARPTGMARVPGPSEPAGEPAYQPEEAATRAFQGVEHPAPPDQPAHATGEPAPARRSMADDTVGSVRVSDPAAPAQMPAPATNGMRMVRDAGGLAALLNAELARSQAHTPARDEHAHADSGAQPAALPAVPDVAADAPAAPAYAAVDVEQLLAALVERLELEFLRTYGTSGQ